MHTHVYHTVIYILSYIPEILNCIQTRPNISTRLSGSYDRMTLSLYINSYNTYKERIYIVKLP